MNQKEKLQLKKISNSVHKSSIIEKNRSKDKFFVEHLQEQQKEDIEYRFLNVEEDN